MMNQRLGWAAGSSFPDMLLSKLRLIQSCNKIYLKLASERLINFYFMNSCGLEEIKLR